MGGGTGEDTAKGRVKRKLVGMKEFVDAEIAKYDKMKKRMEGANKGRSKIQAKRDSKKAERIAKLNKRDDWAVTEGGFDLWRCLLQCQSTLLDVFYGGYSSTQVKNSTCARRGRARRPTCSSGRARISEEVKVACGGVDVFKNKREKADMEKKLKIEKAKREQAVEARKVFPFRMSACWKR